MNNIYELEHYIADNDLSVACFGTGVMANEALKYPQIKSSVIFFMDNDVEKQGHMVYIGKEPYMTISPIEFWDYAKESTIILITSGHYKSIYDQLRDLNILDKVEVFIFPLMRVNLFPESEEFFEERILKECIKEYDVVLDQYGITGSDKKNKIEEMEKYIRGKDPNNRPFVVPRTMIMPTTRCNLRCKGCSSLLPLFTTPQDIDIVQIIRDCRIFFNAVDECIRLTIGGEPFFYPDLRILLENLIDEPKLLGIMLITNGMIIPDEDLIPLLRNPKVFIEISDYGRLEQMSKAITFYEKNDINFIVLTEQTWTDMGGIEYRNRDEEELRFVYMNCDQGRVIKGMHNGKFHTCARSSRMYSLGAYSSETDYFELLEMDSPEEVREKLKAMYYSDHADACNYCDLGALPTKIIEAGIQENNHIKKSKYTIVNRDELERLREKAYFAE